MGCPGQLVDTDGSDHRVVLADFPLTSEKSCPSSHKLSLNRVDWKFFRVIADSQFLDGQLKGFQLELSDNLNGKYDDFVRGASETGGAYIPKATGDRVPVKPTWWSSKCDAARTKKTGSGSLLIARTRTPLTWNYLLARRRIAQGYCMKRRELLSRHYVTPYPPQ